MRELKKAGDVASERIRPPRPASGAPLCSEEAGLDRRRRPLCSEGPLGKPPPSRVSQVGAASAVPRAPFVSALSSVPHLLFLSLGLRRLSKHLSHVLEKGPPSSTPRGLPGSAISKAQEVIRVPCPTPPHPAPTLLDRRVPHPGEDVCLWILTSRRTWVAHNPWATEVTRTPPRSSPRNRSTMMGREVGARVSLRGEE